MIKVNIHLYNDNCIWDTKVKCTIELPYLPRVNDIIWLTESNINTLKECINKLESQYYKNIYAKLPCIEDINKVSDIAYDCSTGMYEICLSEEYS